MRDISSHWKTLWNTCTDITNALSGQREICTDTANYLVSLRATLRQSPDVILLGEMRDHETIQTAMTAAETGHLILSSLHTTGAANTISRIMDVFEPSQQHQIAIQLSMVLQTVISQQLVPDVNGHNIPVFEIMRLTPAIRNMIRDNKIYQIDGVIASSSQADMKSTRITACWSFIETARSQERLHLNIHLIRKC